ncbi:hypothetical protein NMY22_g3567 [Coprinellus aureogranulatus]|nr:hypothetical protein NMY22_g3567 [Coprinellus aureogranulatus]
MAALFTSLASLLLWTCVPSCLGRVYIEADQLIRTTYDYIVIGAGTAGNVVAARLSEDSGTTVLVLEAGISNEGILETQVPFRTVALTPGTTPTGRHPSRLESYIHTATQFERAGDSCSPRTPTRGLELHWMVHHYGAASDYDRLATISGDSGWARKNMKRYIMRHEKFVPPADGRDTPSLHSTTGFLPKSLPGYSPSLDARVVSATRELPAEFPFNEDITSGNVLGVSWLQSSIGGGTRSSSATTYLASAIDRPNLDVLITAHVTKLIRTGRIDGKPVFRGVEFSSTPQGPKSVVYARKEVILSAGSIGTPQILQLSGVGDRADLASLAIDTEVHNPSVGRNLSDHLGVGNTWSATATDTVTRLLWDPAAIEPALEQWKANKTGPLTNGVGNHLGFFRLPKNSTIFKRTPDPSSGPGGAHWEMLVLNYGNSPVLSPEQSYISISSIIISPTSRGYVKLSSSDPFDHPIIDPNYLSSEFDRYTIREGVKAVRRFAQAQAWNGFIVEPVDLGQDPTDEEIDAYIREFSNTVFHPVGTASISPENAKWGVVDAKLRLKGAVGVRVVDASVWPFLPSAHTQGPTYLIAERAASLIRNISAE